VVPLVDVLPAIRSLSHSDKVQLVHLLIEDLTRPELDLSIFGEVPQPVWLPEDNGAGAAVLQQLLDDQRKRQ